MSRTSLDPLLDDRVPALDLVLDVDRLRTWLSSHGETLLDRPYLRYKEGTSCVAALQLASGRAFAYGVSAAAQPKLDKTLAEAPAGAVRAVDTGLRLAVATMAADRDLPAARDVTAAVRALRLDGQHELHADPQATVQVLVHKPQRRLVALLEGATGSGDHSDDQRTLLRAYRRTALGHAVRRHRAVNQVGGLRSAAVLASHPRYALLALRHLPGQPLDVLLEAGRATPAVLRASGAALAVLHNAPIELAGKLPRAVVDDTGVSSAARQTADLVSRLCPHLAGGVQQIVDQLAATVPAATRPVFCHGDFSPDQVVVDAAGRPGLIDWDRAGVGEAASDLASARAAGLTDDQLDLLLDGYGQERRPPTLMRWHLAQAQLMRAADPFRRGSPRWREEIEDQLDVVQRTLDGPLP